VSTLRSQVAFAAKEKAALQAILEDKVLPLAQQLSKGLSDAMDGGSGTIFAHRAGGEGGERLQRQVTALQRLLAATVAAMARGSPSNAGGTPLQSSGGAAVQ
jgi:hypothetical protein